LPSSCPVWFLLFFFPRLFTYWFSSRN
jgi:hypothetical protein